MSELTDLEICKHIAEIEGFTVSHGGDYIFDKKRDLVFKPLSPTITAKGFCIELVEKYELDITSPYKPNGETDWEVGFFINGYSDADSVYNKDLKRAIYLAVIKKSELE